jgi:hypothetical protein
VAREFAGEVRGAVEIKSKGSNQVAEGNLVAGDS